MIKVVQCVSSDMPISKIMFHSPLVEGMKMNFVFSNLSYGSLVGCKVPESLQPMNYSSQANSPLTLAMSCCSHWKTQLIASKPAFRISSRTHTLIISS
jgi:hypothetical protein